MSGLFTNTLMVTLWTRNVNNPFQTCDLMETLQECSLSDDTKNIGLTG